MRFFPDFISVAIFNCIQPSSVCTKRGSKREKENEEEGKKKCNLAKEKTHYDAILIKITFIAYQADVHACHCATKFFLDVFMRRQNILEKLCRNDNRQQLLGHRTSKGKSCGRLHLSCVTSGNCNVSVFLSVVELTTSNHFFLSVSNEIILVGSSNEHESLLINWQINHFER